MVWSSELADHTRDVVQAETQTFCGVSAARRLAEREGLALHWAAPLRRIDGGVVGQTLSAPYIVSEWARGEADFNPEAGVCRKSGPCDSFKRMTAPEARLVGCASIDCATGARIYACSYAPTASPPKKAGKPKA
jgi:hypothetical protein